MRESIDRVRGAGRAPFGVIVGGVLTLAGGLLTSVESRPAADGTTFMGVEGVWTLLILALLLIAFGAAMTTEGGRRRWRPWVIGIAVLGAVGVLVSWAFVLIGGDPWRVTTTASAAEPGRFVLGLPLYLVGCAVAAMSATRARPHVRAAG
ncbi:MAG: hypothetical protein U0869_08000 [Chloroflexota bacterium]